MTGRCQDAGGEQAFVSEVPRLAAWSRVAHASFDGEHADDSGTTRVDGEVLTRMSRRSEAQPR